MTVLEIAQAINGANVQSRPTWVLAPGGNRPVIGVRTATWGWWRNGAPYRSLRMVRLTVGDVLATPLLVSEIVTLMSGAVQTDDVWIDGYDIDACVSAVASNLRINGVQIIRLDPGVQSGWTVV